MIATGACLRHLDDMASNHNVLEEGLGSYPTPHPLLPSKSMWTLISSSTTLKEVLLGDGFGVEDGIVSLELARLNSVFLEVVARDPRNPDLLSRSHSCFSTVFNSRSVLRIHLFINQSECGHSLARQRQGPLHRYFESAQQEKQLEVVFSLLFAFGVDVTPLHKLV